MMQAILKILGEVTSDENRASPPSADAEVIYQAATDGTNTLRYTAGKDAEDYLKVRRESSDEEYVAAIKSQFGL